jgi:GH24 family phage-related lysozyme (muramidase)
LDHRVGQSQPAGRRVRHGRDQAEADALFDHAMGLIEQKLDAMVHIPLADYEAGALLSMQYNIGSSAMASSTVIRLLNLGDRAGAAEHMLDWDHTGTVVSPGLHQRRTVERAVFLHLVDPLNPATTAQLGQGVLRMRAHAFGLQNV